MAGLVVVRVIRTNGSMRFEIQQGLDLVEDLPGIVDAAFTIKESDASAGPDSPSTLLAACHRLGGDE